MDPSDLSRQVNYLDQTLITEGPAVLERRFIQLMQTNMDITLKYMNDEALCFPSFFILRSKIKSSKIQDFICPRNQTALDILDYFLGDNQGKAVELPACRKEGTYSTLKWILATGFHADGMDDQYDRILDMAAIHLIKIYRDTTILPIIIHIIFRRNRRQCYMDDLVWAFFESRDPSALQLIADYFFSSEPEDIKLAHKLLYFIPSIGSHPITYDGRAFWHFIEWLEENYPFLYFTEENFHQTSHPLLYAVSMEAKYLCKRVSIDSSSMIMALSEDDQPLLNRFRMLDDDTQLLLSNYSYHLYRQDPYRWTIWLHYPLAQQIHTAKMRIGWSS